MSTDTEYQGWKNRATWNVALWVNNDYGLYQSAVEYVKRRKALGKKPSWGGFCKSTGLEYDKTPDGFKFYSTKLDFKALSAMLNEILD